MVNIFKSHICNRCGTSFNSEDEDHCRTMWPLTIHS